MHQQPPKTPLLRSTNAANASHVDSSSALTVYVGSLTKPQASVGYSPRIAGSEQQRGLGHVCGNVP